MATDQWPPISWLWAQYNKNSAWYSGDPNQLRAVSHFWGSKEKTKYHIPIAADIAALSAGFIFSGSPTLTSEDEKTNERLQEIMNQSGFFQTVLRGAEMQSAFGGVFLKLNWDQDLVKRPIIAVLPGNAGLPEFKHGINVQNTFWSEVRRDEKTGDVYRRREIYTNSGEILTALFKGSTSDLGRAVGLDSIEETRGTPQTAQSGAGRLLSVYVPNKLPNKESPMTHYGASDYDGVHDLFDALDETYSALMRDIRLGKARLIVPMEFLRRKGDLRAALDLASPTSWIYPEEEEYFTALDINPQDDGNVITAVQPEIRASQYMEVLSDQIRRIYMAAGFSPQSAGIDINGSAESGTALNVRERRSMQTTETKKTYWWQALTDFVPAMLALDRAVFQTEIDPEADITITFADNSQPDMTTVADTVSRLSAAGAASTETMVRMVHPDWTDEDVETEAVRIMHESKDMFDRRVQAQGIGAIGAEEVRAWITGEESGAALENLPKLAYEAGVVGE